MISGVFFFCYGLYVMYRLLPTIDRRLDPHRAEYNRVRGDPLFYRFHRLLLYSGSLAWAWAHRRMEYRDYDFQNLPLGLRLPLVVEFYALLATVVGLVSAAALMEVNKGLGLM